MRTRNENASQVTRPGGAWKNTQNPNSATLGTLGIHGRMACYCGLLESRGIFKLCATCARFDLYGREVQLRRWVGYQGFAA